jgi:hypothetical protein
LAASIAGNPPVFICSSRQSNNLRGLLITQNLSVAKQSFTEYNPNSGNEQEPKVRRYRMRLSFKTWMRLRRRLRLRLRFRNLMYNGCRASAAAQKKLLKQEL